MGDHTPNRHATISSTEAGRYHCFYIDGKKLWEVDMMYYHEKWSEPKLVDEAEDPIRSVTADYSPPDGDNTIVVYTTEKTSPVVRVLRRLFAYPDGEWEKHSLSFEYTSIGLSRYGPYSNPTLCGVRDTKKVELFLGLHGSSTIRQVEDENFDNQWKYGFGSLQVSDDSVATTSSFCSTAKTFSAFWKPCNGGQITKVAKDGPYPGPFKKDQTAELWAEVTDHDAFSIHATATVYGEPRVLLFNEEKIVEVVKNAETGVAKIEPVVEFEEKIPNVSIDSTGFQKWNNISPPTIMVVYGNKDTTSCISWREEDRWKKMPAPRS